MGNGFVALAAHPIQTKSKYPRGLINQGEVPSLDTLQEMHLKGCAQSVFLMHSL